MDINDITKQTAEMNKEFLKNAELLIKLNNPFSKTINNNSGKSLSLTLDKHFIISKISESKTIKDFLTKNKILLCSIIGNKYLILRLENLKGGEKNERQEKTS